jgi:hypothetical protein
MLTPEFLANAGPDAVVNDELAQLEKLVTSYKWEEAEVKSLEAELADAKARFNELSQVAIPELLNQHGLSEIRLRSGEKVIVKEDASVTVPDDKQQKFFDFLKERNNEDIIKLLFQFKRMAPQKMQELFDFLNGYDYDYEFERNVHPQTLKKYFKDLLGIGQENREELIADGKCLKPEDVADVCNVFTYFSTKIK